MSFSRMAEKVDGRISIGYIQQIISGKKKPSAGLRIMIQALTNDEVNARRDWDIKEEKRKSYPIAYVEELEKRAGVR